jgi:hypothetical protein
VSEATYHIGDVLKWAAGYDGEPFHALLCDPPYHLESIVKRFGKPGSAPAKHGKDGAFARASRGFMGQAWDGGDLCFRPETWHAIGQHLYPGAFGVAFASSRGWHRVACAIEDAGFILHPTIFLWARGGGLPKATRIDTQIDRAAGAEREVVGSYHVSRDLSRNGRTGDMAISGAPVKGRELDITAPATPLAQVWDGHRYGLQALAPHTEPILLFQRPYEGRPVSNIVGTGAGALNIDAARVGGPVPPTGGGQSHVYNWRNTDKSTEWAGSPGRWPGNFVLSHLPGCERAACAAGCPVAELDAQTGESASKAGRRGNGIGNGYGGSEAEHNTVRGYDDEGGASRLFFCSDYLAEIDELSSFPELVKYMPRASTAERDAGLDDLPIIEQKSYQGGPVVSGKTETMGGRAQKRNPHPTVKPLKLTEWLASLLLPPDHYAPRRLLVPFGGVASEIIGGAMAGFEHVLGIELSEEYAAVGEARLKHWLSHGRQIPLW